VPFAMQASSGRFEQRHLVCIMNRTSCTVMSEQAP
jgi:hypothetical protein